MKSYASQSIKEDEEQLKAALPKARKIDECAFGIMYSRWRILAV